LEQQGGARCVSAATVRIVGEASADSGGSVNVCLRAEAGWIR